MKAYSERSPLLEKAQSLAAEVGGDDKVATTRGTKRSCDPRVVEDPSIGDGYWRASLGALNGDRAKPNVDDRSLPRGGKQSLRRLIGRAAALAALRRAVGSS